MSDARVESGGYDGLSTPEDQAFVLAPDARLVPVSELPAVVRNNLGCEPDDLILDRSRQRAPSKLIGAQTAALVERFRKPSRIVDALLALAREMEAEPLGLLDAAHPTIQALIDAEFLLPAGAPSGAGGARYGPGDVIDRFTIVRTLRALEDTQVFLAQGGDGSYVAIKSAATSDGPGSEAVAREADILSRLEGQAVPSVVARGAQEQVPYFVMEWIDGVPASLRADEIRRGGVAERWRLLDLCRRIARAYAGLHETGVIHGDVRASNVLVDRGDHVHLIDFGMATPVADEAPADIHRSFDFDTLEPEAASALLDGRLQPQTLGSEQFALGAMLYRLASGQPYRVPAAQQHEALEAIASGPQTLPFATVGAAAWPQLETVLRRALEPNPLDRYSSIRDLAEALEQTEPEKIAPADSSPVIDLVDRFLKEVAAADSAIETLFPHAPRAAVHSGAAGLAWFLYRAAQIRDDGILLARADMWAGIATQAAGSHAGLVAPERGISPARARRSSPLHDAAGPAAMRCLTASARQDRVAVAATLKSFLEVAVTESDSRELFLGDAGHLAASACLMDALDAQQTGDTRPLAASLTERLAALDEWLGLRRRIGHDSALPHVGMAHGWAGVLYAFVVASRAMAAKVPTRVVARLEELAALAEPVGRGVAWVGTASRGHKGAQTPALAPGWCSGSAGYVFLWLAAFDLLKRERYRHLAIDAAWHAWEHPDAEGHLCCGLAGRGLALLRLYQSTGDEEWLERARHLAAQAGDTRPGAHADRYSLFRGELGAALLALELERPSSSVLPLLEPEGWSLGPARR